MHNLAPPPTFPAPYDPPAPAGSGRGRRFLLLFLGLCLLGIAALAALAAFSLLAYDSDYIMPGVQVDGLSIGGLSRTQAQQLLANQWAAQTVRLTAGGESWPVTRAELGLTSDVADIVQQAYAIGRSPATLPAAWRALRYGETLPAGWQLHPAGATTTLNAIATGFNRPAQDATIRLVAGQAEVVPGSPGRALDVEATTTWLAANTAQVLVTGELPLVVQPVLPQLTDATQAAAQINERLSQPVRLTAYDPVSDERFDWVVPPAEWASWVILQQDAANTLAVTWTVDEAPAGAYLQTLATSLGSDRYLETAAGTTALAGAITSGSGQVNLRVYYHPRSHIVQSGETIASIAYNYGMPYPWVQQANPNLDGLRPGQTLVIPSPDEFLPLPVVENKRILLSISQQRLWAYEDGQLKWEWIISTGIEDSPTSPGVYQIQSHEPNAYAGNWDLWMPNFMGIYRPVPQVDFMNGFHGFPTRNGSNLLWTGNLGTPVTYGCILLSTENSALLYEWAEAGVVVVIEP